MRFIMTTPVHTSIRLKAAGIFIAANIVLTVSSCSNNQYGNEATPVQQHVTNLGKILTDKSGMTLYTFNKDKPNTSNCNNGCAIKWPPLLAKTNTQANGRFSIITRADNSKQWAFDKKPLYRWIKDKKPGDTTGEGIKSLWHVAKP
jgi:predicted lipoprotein with Yx(FWY)xxD motif